MTSNLENKVHTLRRGHLVKNVFYSEKSCNDNGSKGGFK